MIFCMSFLVVGFFFIDYLCIYLRVTLELNEAILCPKLLLLLVNINFYCAFLESGFNVVLYDKLYG